MFYKGRYGKFIYRVFFACLLLSLCLLILFWYGSSESKLIYTLKDENWITVKLLSDQKEYVDQKGVHVIVGHYLGDNAVDGVESLNDDIINSNMFDPKPNEGKNGQPVIIPSVFSFKAKQLFRINRFNLMASDRIPLDRTLPDMRKKVCQNKTYAIGRENSASIIIVFHNEAWSTLLRTVKSVINRSPPYLLAEIILVDDASTRKFLQAPLSKFVKQLPIPTYVLRSSKRIGLIRARLLGGKQALGSILVFLDAHCECTVGWLESLIARVVENRTRVVCPIIDIINDETFAYVRSFEKHWGAFNWDLHFRWYTLGMDRNKTTKSVDFSTPFATPVMAGGLFAVDRKYFFEIGAYDEQMEIWGGENLELSFRVWQCGGSIEIVPCSHVGHLFRKSSPYLFPGGVSHILYSNLARVALVWMDEWKEFYFKFHPDALPFREQNVSARLNLRNQLQCRNFKWYLDTVWPQHFMPMNGRFFGKIKNLAESKCLEKPANRDRINQPSGFASVSKCNNSISSTSHDVTDLKQMFVLIPKYPTNVYVIATDESLCLDVLPTGEVTVITPKVQMIPCSENDRQLWIRSDEQLSLQHMLSGLCLDLDTDEQVVILNDCFDRLSQKWQLEEVPWK